MKHISVLVPKGDSVLSSIVGPYKIFRKINDFYRLSGRSQENLFDVKLVGICKDHYLYDGCFSIHAEALIDEVKKTDLIIIPAFAGDIQKALKENEPYYDWINRHYARGAEVASLCMGAFILASTGLLSGKKCTTHWSAAAEFTKMFPDVEMVPDRIITTDNRLYSSGGAYSFLNLVLYLVEKHCGKETALWCSKVFEVDINRCDQSQFIIFRGQKDHEDVPVMKAQQFIENNFREKIQVDQLADMLALSRRNFIRRFKKATSNTPIEYIQRVKIEAAKSALEVSAVPVSEIMLHVGYSDGKAFRNIFRKYTGMSPQEYKKRFGRMALGC